VAQVGDEGKGYLYVDEEQISSANAGWVYPAKYYFLIGATYLQVETLRLGYYSDNSFFNTSGERERKRTERMEGGKSFLSFPSFLFPLSPLLT
jgi:hypothetical protein